MMQERATVERIAVHCQHRLWTQGAMRQCARTFPVRTWSSHGQEVTACHTHEAALRHRYPETAPMTLHERLHRERRDADCEDCAHEAVVEHDSHILAGERDPFTCDICLTTSEQAPPYGAQSWDEAYP